MSAFNSFLSAIGIGRRAPRRTTPAPAPVRVTTPATLAKTQWPQFLNRKQVRELVEMVNNRYFSGRMASWVDDAAAMVFVESSGDYRPTALANSKAKRVEPDGRTSYGLMQVLTGTAGDLYRKGYKAFPATAAALSTPEGGVYFGLAYLDFLSRNFGSLLQTHQDIIRAYNGGQGWKRTRLGPRMTADYYAKYQRQYAANSEVA